MAAKKKKAARRAAPAGGRRKCVVFRKTAKKGGRKLSEPKTVCFKKKEATAADKAKKARVGRMNLKRAACIAKGAPKKACFAIMSR